MAWTDQCKIEAVNHVDRKIDEGLTVRDALKAVSEESDIPVSTLNSWKYPRGSGVVETYHKKEKTQTQHWMVVVNRLKRIEEYMAKYCLLDDITVPASIKDNFNEIVHDLNIINDEFNQQGET